MEITSSDDAATSGPATYPGLQRLGLPSPCGVADWDRQMGVNARRKPFIFNCEDFVCVLWSGILPSPSTSNVNVVVPLTLGNGKLTHLPIKKVLIFNQAFSSRQTHTLLMGFPPAFCGLEKRVVRDVMVARHLFSKQTLLPLSPPNLRGLDSGRPQRCPL